ncbi:hypothetical protein [Streptomyces sp. MI02-7b]|uniref:hypothetical protein n=1 Tax=Streptomyces sp. MI02-7b TaxID=462941 RepID=UPI0029A3BF8B|nr:hypothetical protein [Streptomyces sp. MI02-7b]MDX3072580.1 hypothetical protein [Streptomyces sp. MI02-7b]
MTHLRRALPLLLLPVVVTSAACGTESANRPELEARARALGIARDMVYVTDVPGYTLAAQSVGVVGDHGYGAFYSSPGGGMIAIRVDERRGDPVACSDPDTRPATERGSCEQDESWYRASGTGHEYVFQDGGRVIRLSGDRAGVTRDVLRRAAEHAHQADDRELAGVLPTGGVGPGPVERGDLPADGDGAPQDPFGITAGTSG